VLNTSLIVSGWWTYEIGGGDKYDIQITADNPVSIYLCDSVETRMNGGADCHDTGSSILFESLSSFHSAIDIPSEVQYILLVTQHNDTRFDLTIRTIP
jgi:hypothetical protein